MSRSRCALPAAPAVRSRRRPAFQPHAFAALERDAQHLEVMAAPATARPADSGTRSMPPARRRPRPWAAAAALAEDEGLGAVFQQFDFVDGAQAAAMPAVAGRVRRSAHWVKRTGWAASRISSGGIVAVEIGALPWLRPSPRYGRRGRREEAEHDPALPLARRVAAVAGDGRVDGAVGLGRRALGRGLGHGAEDHVDHAQDGLGIAAHGARVPPRSRGRRAASPSPRQHAGIGRHIRNTCLSAT